MDRVIYKVLIGNNKFAMFYDLEDAMIFIEGVCKRYYNELKTGFNFTIKEVIDDD